MRAIKPGFWSRPSSLGTRRSADKFSTYGLRGGKMFCPGVSQRSVCDSLPRHSARLLGISTEHVFMSIAPVHDRPQKWIMLTLWQEANNKRGQIEEQIDKKINLVMMVVTFPHMKARIRVRQRIGPRAGLPQKDQHFVPQCNAYSMIICKWQIGRDFTH